MPRLLLPYHPSPRQRQRGVALFVVIVLVMLSMLLAVWSSRTSLFNEMLVGNDADYQRAFEAAQALIQDAELDIRGETPNGKLCNTPSCRAYTTALQFPTEAKEINALISTLDGETNKCKDGLCARRTGRQDFWNYTTKTIPAPTALQAGEVTLDALTATGVGARYGQYTGAQLGSTDTPANPILTERSKDAGGWYWIEVMPYAKPLPDVIVDNSNKQLDLKLDVYVVYRITALAKGRKPGSMAVLQETYARQRTEN